MATTIDLASGDLHRAKTAASAIKMALLEIVMLTEDATSPDLGGWTVDMISKLRQHMVRPSIPLDILC